jgi:hypothetical protein
VNVGYEAKVISNEGQQLTDSVEKVGLGFHGRKVRV